MHRNENLFMLKKSSWFSKSSEAKTSKLIVCKPIAKKNLISISSLFIAFNSKSVLIA